MHPALVFSLITTVAVSTFFMAYVFDWNRDPRLQPEVASVREVPQCADIVARAPIQPSLASILLAFLVTASVVS
jgi:hypothetical protein